MDLNQDEEAKFAVALNAVAGKHGALGAIKMLTGAMVIPDGKGSVNLRFHKWPSHASSSALKSFVAANGKSIALEMEKAGVFSW